MGMSSSNAPALPDGTTSPFVASQHSVQFYEDDAVLLDGLSRSIGSALGAGDSAIVIATKAHRLGLKERLEVKGLDVALAIQRGRYIQLDAADTLSKFMVEDWPDAGRFVHVVGSVVERANSLAMGSRGYVTAFGEMVALLWNEGKTEAAIQLEQLWNDLARTHSFYLHCAYPITHFTSDSHEDPFKRICAAHSHVIPAESYTMAVDEAERSRLVSLLQHKAQAFQTIAQEKEKLASSLAIEVEDLRRLHNLTASLGHEQDLQVIMDLVLASVIKVHGTPMGLLSLEEDGGSCLRVAASSGFSKEFLEMIGRGPVGGGACGACLERGQRVVIHDTETEPLFEGYRTASRKAGFRAVHSTPLLDRTGKLIGVVSVHFPHPYTPSERQMRLTDLYSQIGASAIENARLHHEAHSEIVRRKNVEEALRKSEQFARSIVESSVDCIKILDENGKLIYMSSPGQRALGIQDVNAFLGKSWIDFWKGQDRENAASALESARSGEVGRMQGFCPDLSGAPKWWDVKLTAMRVGNGKVERILAISREITELRQAETALIEAEKLAATGRLAATIAHEINNPLEAVTNLIFLAKHQPNLPPKALDHLDFADQELNRISFIAQQTLGFYRESSGPEWLAVEDVVHDLLTIYERKFKYKKLAIHCSIDPQLRIFTKAGEFRQSLSNLIVNAIDASREGGKIWIRARSLPSVKRVLISVADNGVGMTEGVQKRLFTPFFTTKQQIGTGLGLWTTKNMIEKQNGSIRVRSRVGVKSGTSMAIFIPSQSETQQVH